MSDELLIESLAPTTILVILHPEVGEPITLYVKNVSAATIQASVGAKLGVPCENVLLLARIPSYAPLRRLGTFSERMQRKFDDPNRKWQTYRLH